MTDAQLRTRIRALISSGNLPLEPPRAGTDSVDARRPAEALTSSGNADGAVCLICAQAGPQTTYEYPDGRRIHVHRVPCDVAWREEAARLRRGEATPHGIALPKDAFIQWLDGRLAQDADFERRMQAALRELRIERIAAAIRAARSRISPAEKSASRDRSII